MEIEDTFEYISKVNKENKTLLLEYLRDSYKTTENYVLTITKWIAFLIFIYFLFKTESISNIEINGASVDLNSSFELLIPLASSLLILFYIVSSIQKGEILKTYRLLFMEIYGIDGENNSFERVCGQTLPGGLLNKIISNGRSIDNKTTILNMLISLPLALVQLLPIVFTVYSLSIILNQYWEIGVAKVIFFISCTFLVYGIWLFLQYLYIQVIEQLALKNKENL
ncbi:MAG: hypothetical protein K0S24_3738 [Sphingobacterium sp.]|jgi:hypothetical protein|nr:hypothetical protein [Sphingobacterium sp.]